MKEYSCGHQSLESNVVQNGIPDTLSKSLHDNSRRRPSLSSRSTCSSSCTKSSNVLKPTIVSAVNGIFGILDCVFSSSAQDHSNPVVHLQCLQIPEVEEFVV